MRDCLECVACVQVSSACVSSHPMSLCFGGDVIFFSCAREESI